MAVQQHLQFLRPTWNKPGEWIRNAAITVNGILSGGPFPYLWRDNMYALSGAKLGSTGNPSWATFLNGTQAYIFSDAPEGVEELHCAFHVDHDYALGTKLYPKIHWTSNTAGTGTVRWGFEYTLALGHQQEVFPATTTTTIEQAFAGVAFTHMDAEVIEADAIDGKALLIEPDSVINMRVFRDAGHANDTLSAGAFALVVGLHYQAERRGTVNRAPNFFGP